VGAASIVVKEDDGGVFYPLIVGGNPIPGSAAGGCKAKPGTQLLLVGQLVEGFHVQGLETINRPTFGPPAPLAGVLQLEADGLDGGFVLVQLQESLGEQLAQFAFDGIGLGIQQTAQVGVVCRLELIGGWARTVSSYGPANPRGDDEERGGKDKRAEDEERKFVHTLMILQRRGYASVGGASGAIGEGADPGTD